MNNNKKLLMCALTNSENLTCAGMMVGFIVVFDNG